jgi:hypothetical protein
MKRKFEILATVGTWTDSTTGKKNKRTVAVGSIYESTHGKLVMRIDAIPVSPDWSGWMQLKPCFPELPPGRKVSPGMPAAPEEEQDSESDEDRPF